MYGNLYTFKYKNDYIWPVKKLFCIFALLLCYRSIPAISYSIFEGRQAHMPPVISGCSLHASKGIQPAKSLIRLTAKNTYNHRKKAMRGDEHAAPPTIDTPYKAPSGPCIDLFLVQADYFLRPFFGHSKRGPPAVQ